MADEDYNKKLESLRKYIPFLVNMMLELKAKGNREAQLTKIQSLHDMITDTRKKLKIETLKRCEEVLTNIYFKVNPQLRSSKAASKVGSPKNLPGIDSPRSTPLSPSPPRDIMRTTPVNIPTEKVSKPMIGFPVRSSPKSYRPKVDVYSNVVMNNPAKVVAAKVPDMSKPPISLDDLKTLEDDVQQKISDAAFGNKTVDELQEVRKQLQLQLRVEQVTSGMSPEQSESINTTVRNTNIHSKRLTSSDDKPRRNESPKASKHSSPIKEIKSPTCDKRLNKEKEDVAKHSVHSKTPKKTTKDSDIFGNLLSSIDDKLLEEKKKSKKGDRRSSITICREDSGSTSSLHSDKGDRKETDPKKTKESKDSKHIQPSIDKEKKPDRKREGNKDKMNSDAKDKSKTDKKESDDKEAKGNITSKNIEMPKSKVNQPNEIILNSSNLLKRDSSLNTQEISGNGTSSKSSSEVTATDNTLKPVSVFKRLANKYNPKPKPPKIIDSDIPDIDKDVSDSIEKLMKVSPAKPLTSPLGPRIPAVGEKVLTSGDVSHYIASMNDQSKPIELPDILQKIFSKPLLGDIIPKRLNEPIALSNPIQNRPQSSTLVIQPPEPSPTSKILQFQPPSFVPPPQSLDFVPSADVMARPSPVPAPGHGLLPISSPGHGLLSPLSSGHGMLPTPPMPPSLPGFNDHEMNMGYATPRMDFDMPGTPMANFDTPMMEFEPPSFMRNHVNQRFVPSMQEHQMRGFDPRNANYMGQGHFSHQPEVGPFNHYDLTQGPVPFYGSNQMPHLASPEMQHYMPDQAFYQERLRWSGRPGDPRSYREYKEMKERQERDAKVFHDKQKEIKDPRLAPRESIGENVRDPRLAREVNSEPSIKEKPEVPIRDPRLSRAREKSVERTTEFKPVDFRERGRSRDRVPGPRGRDRFNDTSSSRDSRSRGRESRFDSNKFDKMYSRTNRARSRSRSRGREDKGEEEDDSFISPLDSLYNAGDKGKTGRGYGVQKFRIPRKTNWDKGKRRDETRESRKTGIVSQRRRIIEVSDSDNSDTNNADDGLIPEQDSDVEIIEGEPSEKDVDTNTEKTLNDESESNKDVLLDTSDFDSSRIKVVIKSRKEDENDGWESTTDDFISEYDREFQNENKNKYTESSSKKTKLRKSTRTTRSLSKTVRDDIAKTKAESDNDESKIQVEEPSSSQDLLDAPAPLAADTFKKPAQPIEPDNSTKNDGATTPQEITGSSKSEEPSEQNILAHFFENLLKSNNKKDKKTALFSLIETFSDSFDTREIQKIRKIINANEDIDDASDEEKERPNSVTPNQSTDMVENANDTSALQEEQPIVGSTTEDEHGDLTDAVFNPQPATSETQVNEVTKSTDESAGQQDTEASKSDESLDQTKELVPGASLEPVVVSVGERIKNRKRKPCTTKPKKKCKSELDLLHEDIQDMFIRDGVLTATGKRMCRILKDDPNVLVSSDQNPDAAAVAEQPKKIRKKPGPKPKVKVNTQELAENTIKDMRIVIKKMPDEVINTSIASTRQLRSRTRQSSFVETDEETPSNLDDASLGGSLDIGSDKSDLEEESLNESEDEDKHSQNSEDTRKPRSKRRKAAKWASGIITKWKKKKSQNKSKENSPERTISPASSKGNEVASLNESDVDKLIEPDKDYYYDYFNKQKLKCKLCKYTGHLMTGHYLKEHAHSEVLSSRFPPQVAAEAIDDFAKNGKIFENIVNSKMSTKYHYSCRMCGYNSFVTPIFFYEHITTHTGEYRHQCGLCDYFAATSKTMAGHFALIHPDQEKKAIRRTYGLAVVFAYMCGECNYLQLKEKNVEDHANIFHLGERTTIYKINMSTILDDLLAKSVSSMPELKAIDSSSVAEVTPSGTEEKGDTSQAQETTKFRKPDPKSKVAATEMTSEVESPEKPVLRKRPGPKSKTLPVIEKEPAILTKDVEPSPPPAPVRRKPGPKSKTQKPKVPVPEEPSKDAESIEEQHQKEVTVPQTKVMPSPTPSNEDGFTKDVPVRKRRRSLDKLIPEDSGDDLDTIITLSSRSSRAAKEKATAKLKTLMESNEGTSVRRKSESESSKKDKELETETTQNQNKTIAEVADAENKEQSESENTIHTENVTETPKRSVEEMRPLTMSDAPSKDKDLNVFTCKNDILQEDAKKIEADRLRQMDELNKSIGSRTLKLDFVNKLSNRLNNEQQSENENIRVQVKVEPKDNYINNESATCHTPTMPILKPQVPEPNTKPSTISKLGKSPVLSKKPVFEGESAIQQPGINFRQNKPNSLFSNMIEKLQGKINEAAVQEESASSNVGLSGEETTSTDREKCSSTDVFISVGGLIRVTKAGNEIIYSCHTNKCYVATKDKMVFQLHCKFGHKDLNLKSSLCDKCGVVVEITPDTTLLENLYDHLVFAHSDFISKSTILRMRRLSGDKLSIKKERTPVVEQQQQQQDFEAEIDTHVLRYVSHPETEAHGAVTPMETESSVALGNEENAASEATLELAEDNPFSFKIASVMSLAESNDNPSPHTSPAKPAAKDVSKPPPLKPVPPLTLIASVPKQQASSQQPLIVKEAKLTTAELGRPKKAPKALQKFIECQGDLYKCPHFYCMYSTNVRTLLMCHLNAHKCDSATMVPCVYCDMKTPWEHVPMHIDIRHASSKYSCSYCLYRASVKEYVCLHQEQAHPDSQFVVISLPPHKAAKKFSVADSTTDYKALCEPFCCVHKEKDDGEPEVREYLFETEFVNHLNTAHPNNFIKCGYPKCNHLVLTSKMLNHWASFHGVCTYQCGYCKTSSKNMSKMYTHFSQLHPNLYPDVLVRKNESLPQDRELRFTDEAFQHLVHIRKIPSSLLNAIGKRARSSIKLVQLTLPSAASEESSTSSRLDTPTSGISSGASLLIQPVAALNNVPSTQSLPTQLLVSNPNLQLIVATSSGSNEKLYLVPTSLVSPKGQLVTSTAPISKVVAQTSSASKSVLNGLETLSRDPVRIGDITIYPSDLSAVSQPIPGSSQESVVVTSSPSAAASSAISVVTTTLNSSTKPDGLETSEALVSSTQKKVMAKSKSVPKTDGNPSPNNEPAEDSASKIAFQDDLASENGSTALSEDDMLQTAIQSILDQDDDSNNSNTQKSTTPNISRPVTPAPLLSDDMVNPPPLVLITNGSPTTAPDITSSETDEVVTPVEHVEVAGNLPEGPSAPEDEDDPLNLESTDESNSEVPFVDDSDAVDPFSEDPLIITQGLHSDLSSGDPLSLEETVAGSLEVNADQPEPILARPVEAGRNKDPLKIVNMQRSVSMVSNSDDESDSSNSEKKKSGLIGYQLFRCAVCNLSFSNVKPFKSHITNSSTCRKPGPKAFHCVHCDKKAKTPQTLADHIMTHGVLRFSCSFCNEKFTMVGVAKNHMKNRHSIHQTNLVPLKADRNNMETDDFVIRPCQANPPMAKDKESLSESPKLSMEDQTYNPDQIETIPIRQIFSTNVKCGLCNYQTKVRVNIIRHLQMHLDEKSVPDIAPVNPVPCLEKNEKMFDKMINLAASSITTGRMGGPAKADKDKVEDKYPEFIPTHRRFVCCAQGCSYLCPEEGNLKHHLMALHSDESNFTCAHCKIKIEPSEIENVIKHFKLHGLHLYKCHYCHVIHHLKHKIEKHITDGHLDMAVKVITIRSMESEPPQDFAPQEEVVTPQPITTSKFKPWSCCMCKAKYHTKGDVQSHIAKKHNIDAQYKCTLCAFKNDQEEICRAHFKWKHPHQEFDFILVYQKIEEEIPKDELSTPFDTTPLWQRDKPRVRHIRGILFDESSPPPTKSPKKVKTYAAATPKVSVASASIPTPSTTPKAMSSASTPKATSSVSTPKTTSSVSTPKVTPSMSAPKVTPSVSTPMSSTVSRDTFSKNIFDCIDAVARGTAETLKNKPGSSGVSSGAKVISDKSRSKKDGTDACPQSANKSEGGTVCPVDKNPHGDVPDESGTDDVVIVAPPSNVIVIDSDESDTEIKLPGETVQSKDDDTPKTKDKDSKTKPMAKNRALKRQNTTDLLHEAVKMAKIEEPEDEDYHMSINCSQKNLIDMFGGFGAPNNKQWKCPKCNQFKSKRVGDFMFHIFKDFNTYRYRCKACSDVSITYKYMQDHIKLHPGFSEDIIEALSPNVKLETWIHMVIREQTLVILKNAPLFNRRPLTGSTDIKCYFCHEKFMSMPECCEHMLYHWAMMPYQCQHCPHEFYTIYDLKYHHSIEHPDAKLYCEPKGPTLKKAVQCIESPKKRPPKPLPDVKLKKKARLDDNPNEVKKEEITSGIVINTYNGKRARKSSSNPKVTNTDTDVINIDDDEDDLVIVSKTDDQVPNEDDVFACDACAYIADTEVLVTKHLQEQHGVRARKYHILSKSKSETETAQKMACNICDQIFTELKLRRHFIENHFEGQMYVPYRFKCGLCSSRFLTPSRIKMHYTRTHALSKFSYECVIPTSKTTSDKKMKYKQFFCTLCSYSTVSVTTVSIRSHVKGHLKPLLCTYCNTRFRYYSEICSHTTREHGNLILSYSTLDDVMKEFADTMKSISESAVPVTDEQEPITSKDSVIHNLAKKSTSAPFPSPKDHSDSEAENSPQKELDLSSITTTFELNELEYTTTAEQMMKMVNLDTYVDMSSCIVDILSLDES